MDSTGWALLIGGAIAVVVSAISAVRLIQRLAEKRYLSAFAFALRLLLGGYFVWAFIALAMNRA